MIRKKYKLYEICEFTNGGAWTQHEYSSTGIPVIQVTNLQQGSVDLRELKFLNADSYDKYKKHELKYDDLVIATVGSHATQPNSVVGRASNIPKEAEGYLLNQNAVCIRSITPEIEQKFLIYLGKSKIMHDYIISRAKGSANQVRMALSSLKEFEFDFPDIQTQRKVSKILSSYDDLIENNSKRIKLLEESVELIYKEWFVNLKFPGYEKCNIVDGVPEGWENINLYEFSEVKMGYPFKSKDFNEEGKGKPAIRIRDIPNQSTKTYTTQEVSDEYIIKNGDILIGMDGIFHNDIWAGEEGYLVQRVCRLRAMNDNYQGYLWQAIKPHIDYYEKTISGATVAHLGAKHLKEINILKPNKEFDKNINMFNNILKQKINLLNENKRLKEARDILIPRLISGEIEV